MKFKDKNANTNLQAALANRVPRELPDPKATLATMAKMGRMGQMAKTAQMDVCCQHLHWRNRVSFVRLDRLALQGVRARRDPRDWKEPLAELVSMDVSVMREWRVRWG